MADRAETIEISDASALPDNPLVSVYMLTYLHKKFIVKAVESVITQQCEFPFELIIGEDCSPDGTIDVLRSLQQRQPGLIRILTAKSNVGPRANAKRCQAAARGKYVGICEGDDYWTDPTKLARQVALMEYMPQVSLVCHAVRLVDDTHLNALARVHRIGHRSRLLGESELILGDGALVPTCSILVRADVLRDRPEWWQQCPIGDYPLVLRASQQGRVAYIDRVMGVYRINVRGSWSARNRPELSTRAHHAVEIQKMLSGFARDTDGRFDREVSTVTSKYWFDAIVRTAGNASDRRVLFKAKRRHLRAADRIVATLALAVGRNLGWLRTPFKRIAHAWLVLHNDVLQPRLPEADDRAP